MFAQVLGLEAIRSKGTTRRNGQRPYSHEHLLRIDSAYSHAFIPLFVLFTADPQAQYDLLAKHIKALYSIHALRNAKLVVGVEANLGFEAQHVLHALRQRGFSFIALHEGAQDGPGILTTNASKELMCIGLQELLDYKRIFLSKKLVSISGSPIEMVNTLIKQLNQFAVLVEPPRTPFGQVRRTYTGKIAGNQDDLCISLQLGVIAMRVFQRNDKYKRFH